MQTEPHDDAQKVELDALPTHGGETPPAWEMIDVGRYRPRRIRGSYLGRELG